MAKVLEFVFRGKDATSATLQKIGLTADQTTRKLSELGKGGGDKTGWQEKLDKKAKSLEQTFGEDRSINKLLQGGLVGFAGEKLGEAAAKAVELKNAFKEGKIGAAGIAQSLLESLPIIGGFAKAGASIRELFLGEQGDIDKINAKSAAQNQITGYQLTIYEDQKKRIKEIGDILTDIGNRRAKAGLEGYSRDVVEFHQQGAKRLSDIDDKRQAETDARNKKTAQQIDELNKQRVDGKLAPGDFEAGKKRIYDASQKDLADIGKRWGEVRSKESDAYEAEREEKQNQANQRTSKLFIDHEREITDIRSKARQDRLHALGLDGQAELEAIKSQADAKRDEIKARYLEEIKTVSPGDRDHLTKLRDQQLGAVDAEARSATGNTALAHQKAFVDQQRQQRQEVLDAQANLASTPGARLTARTAAEKNRLRDEMADRAKGLAQVLSDPTLTDAQKKSAQMQAAQWAGAAQMQMQRNIIGQTPHVDHLFDLSESRTLTGEGAAARERQDDPTAKTAANTEQIAKGQADFQKTLAGVLQQLMIANGASPQQVSGLFPGL